jgi:hypothetical protein
VSKNNTQLIGGAYASLYEAPDGHFIIQKWGIPEPPIHFLTLKDALLTFNELNKTNYTEDLKVDPKGISLPQSPVIGEFESSSSPGTFHKTKRASDGTLICPCTGWITHGHCWHTDLLMEILVYTDWKVLAKTPVHLTLINIEEVKRR